MQFLIQISVGVYKDGLPTGFAISTRMITLDTLINTQDMCQFLNDTTQEMINNWIQERKSELNFPCLIKPDAISITKL